MSEKTESALPSALVEMSKLQQRKRILYVRWCASFSLLAIALTMFIVMMNRDPPNDEENILTRTKDSVLSKATLQPTQSPCTTSCRLSLVESMPEGLTYNSSSDLHRSTYQTWADLLAMAQHTVEIASFYWTLRSSEVAPDPSSQQGEAIFQAILKAGTERGLKVRIVQSKPKRSQPNLDTKYLEEQRAAEVRSVDFPRLLGGGVLHSKMWLIDRQHVYVGSANMDWRSLTQVKELGAVIYNCSCLAEDMAKLFDVYWLLGGSEAKIPAHWPEELSTQYNIAGPMQLFVNNTPANIYISSSPPPLCPSGRTSDLDAILNVIQTAEKFVSIAVMDYFPLLIYTKTPRFWGDIDNALRSAAIDKHVRVQLLISHWNHTRPSLRYFLTSLRDLTGAYPGVTIEAKWFVVPSTPEQSRIPYSRVNHNKYMVSDNTAFIGTSNWSGDYFVNTAGIGLVVRDTATRKQLQDVFDRDWNSQYAQEL